MPGRHGLHRHRHRLTGRSGQCPGCRHRFQPLIKAPTQSLPLLALENIVGAAFQQLLATVEPVIEVIEQRRQQRLHQSPGLRARRGIS